VGRHRHHRELVADHEPVRLVARNALRGRLLGGSGDGAPEVEDLRLLVHVDVDVAGVERLGDGVAIFTLDRVRDAFQAAADRTTVASVIVFT